MALRRDPVVLTAEAELETARERRRCDVRVVEHLEVGRRQERMERGLLVVDGVRQILRLVGERDRPVELALYAEHEGLRGHQSRSQR
jgi:hypothetical protein